jgi:molecular chaperone HtpG
MSAAEKINNKETLGFQTEVAQILDLMIHSLYSNKEIFLRELISNASDACDKLRFEGLKEDKLYEDDKDLKIWVDFDKEARTITLRDNGIGMTRDEVIQYIGTIAHSGTKAFLKTLTGDKKKDANLIGQFGVGFYSSFIVADKVTLTTRKAGTAENEAVCWESAGKGDYTLEGITQKERGTKVVLHLREGEDEYLDDARLKQVVQKFSDHISLPVIMKDAEDHLKDEVVNKASALWTRQKTSITEKEYNEFYKTVSHDFGDPLAHVHSQIEGNLAYTILLYIPEKAPYDLWTQEHRVGVKLYVKRVFIMDDAEKVLPKYLRFVRGIVDSDDLELNVSREILQENQIIENIKRNAIKKILGLLSDMQKNEKEKYLKFWSEFGPVFKEGVVEDFINKEQVASLCQFSSTFNDKKEQEITLDDYIFRMKKEQEGIYYMVADSFDAAKNSPLLEAFRKREIEVLLLNDRVDHWFSTHTGEYKGKKLISIAKGDIDFNTIDGESKDEKKDNEKHKGLTEKFKTALGDLVKDVRVSHRLVKSPTCIVGDKNDIDPNMQRMLEQFGQEIPEGKVILEINPDHALIKKMGGEPEGTRFTDWAKVLLDQAVLADGGQLKDPAGFVQRLNDLILAFQE